MSHSIRAVHVFSSLVGMGSNRHVDDEGSDQGSEFRGVNGWKDFRSTAGCVGVTEVAIVPRLWGCYKGCHSAS